MGAANSASRAGKLEVVIVSYRCESLLRSCLMSLREFPPRGGMTVRVIDNASGDGTAEMVAKEFPEAVLSVNEENIGFAAATNMGLRAGDSPYALVLNPDTEVTAGALDRLLELMDSRPEVGVSGPRLEQPDGTFDHAAKRSFPTPLGALAHFTGLGRADRAGSRLAQYRAPALAETEAGAVDAVNGAFMLIRRSALDEVGLFDEGYWMYMEDLDLSYRFAQAGWLSWYEPGAKVAHVKSGTAGEIRSPRLTYAFHYGMLRFYRKHYAGQRNPLVNAAVYAGIAVKLGVSLVRNAVVGGVRRLRA